MIKQLCIVCLGVLFGCNSERAKDSSKDINIGGASSASSTATAESLGHVSSFYRKFTSSDPMTWDRIGDLSNDAPMIRPELKDLFCEDAYKLNLLDNFDALLAILCTDKKPNETFDKLDRYGSRVTNAPVTVRISMEHGDDGFSTGAYVVVYRFPVEPKWLRTAAIVHYLYNNSEYDYLKFTGSVVANLSRTLAGTLQFGKWQMTGFMEITTPDGKKFTNSRKTEMNSFQVTGGNPDIGLGAERLLDKDNPDYKNYQTATLTIGNQGGGSTLFTLIRVTTKNNGYKDISEKIFADLALSQGIHVFDGIMKEEADGQFDPNRNPNSMP